MKRLAITLLTACAVCAAASAPGGSGMPRPNASEAGVYAAIERVDTGAELVALHRLAREGDGAGLLARVRQVAERPDWPPAAREYVLWTFTQSLSDLRPGAVAADVIRYLNSIRPEVRVPHPDDDRLGIVLFNIPAATAGAVSEWRRGEAMTRASRLLRRGPEAWLDGWLTAQGPDREGFIAMLDYAGGEDLRSLADAAADRPNAGPEFAVVGAQAGIRLRDPDRLARALGTAGVSRLAALSRAAADAFDAELARRTLAAMAATAPPENTSAVLAALAPRLVESDAGVEDLFGLLGHEALGGAAALALARSGDAAIRARLETIAAGAGGPASRRATAALGAVNPGTVR